MRPAFHPRLINGPYDDPGLFVSFPYQNRALLFDLGDITALPPREILKISHVFVSHAHMDHFIGFDRLLRLILGRDKEIALFGPEGIIRNVTGKLTGYAWNLVENYPNRLAIKVTEVAPDRLRSCRFVCRDRFRPQPGTTAPFGGVLLAEPAFTVSAVLLDHRMPCLGFSVRERFHINIRKERLDELGLAAGPWLNGFKRAVFADHPSDRPIDPPRRSGGDDGKAFTLGELRDRIARITPGQKITYITDVAYTEENARKIIALAGNSDHLFIEAAFLEADRGIAREKGHLTAGQAGRIARKAGVRRLTPFHFSPRYHGRENEIRAEAEAAFKGM